MSNLMLTFLHNKSAVSYTHLDVYKRQLLHHLHIRKERAGSMTKKKPDFLRDLDTAIMDELTGGGIKGNAAGLVGTLTQIKEIKQLCGLPFCGYMAKLETVRPSGVPDEVTVVFAEDVPYLSLIHI